MDTSGRCCLLSTSRGRPVHLWDAVSGTLRASYVGFNHLDEVDAAIGGLRDWLGEYRTLGDLPSGGVEAQG